MKKKLIILQLLPLAIFTQLQAASFNCKNATTTVEKTICSDENLSTLDNYLSIAYRKALKNNKRKVQKLQSKWIKNKRNICKNDFCIRDAYISQIMKLQAHSNSKYTGHYEVEKNNYSDSDIDILQLNDNKIYLHGISVTKSRGHNIGEVEGFFFLVNDKIYYKGKDGDSFTITFKKNSLVITESKNDNVAWGAGVDFDGIYKKIIK